MKEGSEIKFINKHAAEASTFNAHASVVPANKARSAVERAYLKGISDGIETVKSRKGKTSYRINKTEK